MIFTGQERTQTAGRERVREEGRERERKGRVIHATHFHTLAANFLPKRVLRKKKKKWKLDLTVTHPFRARGTSLQNSAHGSQTSRHVWCSPLAVLNCKYSSGNIFSRPKNRPEACQLVGNALFLFSFVEAHRWFHKMTTLGYLPPTHSGFGFNCISNSIAA